MPSLDDLIRGDVPLARKIFNDPRQRRLIPKLQAEGWPIFDLAGKRCADPRELERYRRELIERTRKAARKAGPLVGLSLLPSGALAISIGLAFALRFPGPVGDTVLTVAAITATAGEFLGPARLRRALRSAGEVDAPAAQGADA